MRPYLALLYDSLREAMHSRVLWLLLGLILLVLLATAPLSIGYPPTSMLVPSDIVDMQRFAEQLLAAAKRPPEDPARKIWDSLEESLQREITKFSADADPSRAMVYSNTRPLTRQLNDIVDQSDFFSADDLQRVELSAEGQTLAKSPRGPAQQARLNRLMIESCFPGQLQQRASLSAQVSYLGWPVGDQIPVGQKQAEQFISIALTGFTNFFLGFVGVFAGILVTASIIPNTFETGSVNLLLSKPISRSLLYLTKIIGGCWFVLFNGSLLVLGIWIIVGCRLGVWNHRLLWSIPLFLFVFLIYYSVSALAGAVSRNTVVAIAVTVIFWLVCFLVGTSHELIRAVVLDPLRLITVIRAGDELISLTESGQMQRWEPSVRRWQAICEPETKNRGPDFARRNQLLGPVYDPPRDRILAIQQGWSAELVRTSREDDWKRVKLRGAPQNCRALFPTASGQYFVLARDGIARLDTSDRQSDRFPFLGSLPAVADRFLPKGNADANLGPTGDNRLSRDAVADVTALGSELYIAAIDQGVLYTYRRDAQNKLEVLDRLELGDADDRFLICGNRDQLLVADESGRIRLFKRSGLKQTLRRQPVEKVAPRFALTSPDERWLAVVFHDGNAWLYDTQQQREHTDRLPGQGDISAIGFTADNTLLVADRTQRVREIDLSNDRLVSTVQPVESILIRSYRYLLDPIHRVFPRPNELAQTNHYVLTESKSLNTSPDLRESRAVFDPWSPLWSSAIFTAMVIAAGCVYVSRVEF